MFKLLYKQFDLAVSRATCFPGMYLTQLIRGKRPAPENRPAVA